jgi:hypothetical protein
MLTLPNTINPSFLIFPINRIYTLLLAVCLAIASGTATQCAIKDVTDLISLLQPVETQDLASLRVSAG